MAVFRGQGVPINRMLRIRLAAFAALNATAGKLRLYSPPSAAFRYHL